MLRMLRMYTYVAYVTYVTYVMLCYVMVWYGMYVCMSVSVCMCLCVCVQTIIEIFNLVSMCIHDAIAESYIMPCLNRTDAA